MDTGLKNRVICILFALVFGSGLLFGVFWPKAEYSEQERRKLAQAPQLSAEAVWSGRFMRAFEAHITDTFPFRDTFRRVNAWAAADMFRRQDYHGLYLADGYLAAVEYPFQEASLNYAVERFRFVCQKYLTEENAVYVSVIPDKNCFLAEESGHLCMDYNALEQQVEAKADFAEYVSISDLLEKEDYYKTDTHWRQEKIIDVAKRLAKRMGAACEEEYTLHTLEQDFYGVYYGQAALPIAPDRLQYLTSEAIDACRVYDWENRKEIPVYHMEKAAGADPYEMFLSGSLSLLTIENPDAPKGKKLILFRDSFGSSIAPLWISGYSQITLVDIRYIQPEFLGNFVDFKDCDVLFLYSTLTWNNSETLN